MLVENIREPNPYDDSIWYRGTNVPGGELTFTGRNGDMLGKGIYFTNDPSYAALFGKHVEKFQLTLSSVLPEWKAPKDSRNNLNQYARAHGYDAIMGSIGDGVYQLCVLDPREIHRYEEDTRNIVENANYYASATPEQLRQIARDEGAASSGTLQAGDCDWYYDPTFPLAKIAGAMPNGNWSGWYKDELTMDQEDELNRSWDRLSQEDIQEPIIVSLGKDGTPDIWDGWHRTAGQIVRGAKTIPAIVGIER